MAIALEDDAIDNNNWTASVTRTTPNVTPAGVDRGLIILHAQRSFVSVSAGPTWNASATGITDEGISQRGTLVECHGYSLIGPAAAAAVAAITLSAARQHILYAAALSGVDQTDMTRTNAQGNDFTTAATSTVGTETGDVVFHISAWQNAPVVSIGAGETTLVDPTSTANDAGGKDSGGTFVVGISHKTASGASVTMTHTATAATPVAWETIVVKPSGGAAAAVPHLTLLGAG